MVQSIIGCYINKVGQSILLVIVMQSGLGTCQIGSKLLDTSLWSVEGLHVTSNSRKHKCIALSTAKAEYAALFTVAQECMGLRQLEAELSGVIFEDDQSTITMAKNFQFHQQAKHIDIRHHFVRKQIAYGTIQLKYCPTTEMTADIFMKGLK